MQTFTNQFNIAVSNSKTEVVLKFSQVSPVIQEDNSITGTEITPVADLVMTMETAQSLAEILNEMIQQEVAED